LAALEKRCGATHRGFESLPLRQKGGRYSTVSDHLFGFDQNPLKEPRIRASDI